MSALQQMYSDYKRQEQNYHAARERQRERERERERNSVFLDFASTASVLIVCCCCRWSWCGQVRWRHVTWLWRHSPAAVTDRPTINVANDVQRNLIAVATAARSLSVHRSLSGVTALSVPTGSTLLIVDRHFRYFRHAANWT